ncbi:cutinase transcription factor 1 beta [Phlyctema vagabunda]|uniref:Cutinase transcription factor 1 beta n=1 Tax=Phlyctema vagabunda TaxID=108571 RepID=A0ABR4PH49_9HELO
MLHENPSSHDYLAIAFASDDMHAVIMSTENPNLPSDGASATQSPTADPTSKKRDTSAAALDSAGNPKPVKRRAAKACAACRARKVRCDVMQRYHVTEDGEVTCSNCTMDGIKCVIEESKRRKKHLPTSPGQQNPAPAQSTAKVVQSWGSGVVNPTEVNNPEARRWSSGSTMSHDAEDLATSQHVPHSIYQNVTKQIDKGELLRQAYQRRLNNPDPSYSILTAASLHGDMTSVRSRLLPSPPPPNPVSVPLPKHALADFLRPLPQRLTSIDIDYLYAKGALSLPDDSTRNALLQSYLEYVHPYMPLIELHELLEIINDGSGQSGKISLLLFQAVMFAGTAFVDMEYLTNAGFTNRKAARKAFFQKARVLYDFDYEVDRVSLVQSLLLMTYWYETPDDQKDTWHWMGVAISLAHTIGLHRDPGTSNMDENKKKLWKRIWWSCFMRDRLIALGMRRPTRVKDEDYDVPMLTEADFELQPLGDHITIIPQNCTLIRDVEAQRELAQMCIAKAKLCLCVSHVLSAQYSVLVKHQGMQCQEGSARSSVMLFPKKLDQTDEVKDCDIELSQWVDELPPSCRYSENKAPGGSGAPVFVHRSLLHMVYFTTLSALHRPQVLPAADTTQPDKCRELQDLSRKKVREASREITRISQDLHSMELEKYLPTTGVTVLLPAIIIHLLDIKSCNDEARQAAMDGFCQCMVVLEKLRDNYSSADFATQFLEAAIRKADIDVVMARGQEKSKALVTQKVQEEQIDRRTPPSTTEEFLGSHTAQLQQQQQMDPLQNSISVRTPPESEISFAAPMVMHNAVPASTEVNLYDTNIDLNDFLNFDASNTEMWNVPLEEGAHGESGGFLGDMNWIDQEAAGWSRLNSPLPELNPGVFGLVNVEPSSRNEVGGVA